MRCLFIHKVDKLQLLGLICSSNHLAKDLEYLNFNVNVSSDLQILVFYAELPGPPANFEINANATCVFLSAEKPDSSNGVITHYKVKFTMNSLNSLNLGKYCYCLINFGNSLIFSYLW